MPRVLSFTLAAACLCVGYAVVSYAQQPVLQQQQAGLNANAGDDDSVLMRAKLSSSQKVVEGLMAGDYSMILKGGEDLLKICDSKHWQPYEDQVVVHYRSELRRSAMKLLVQAKEENLDGAAYTYMHTMTTCINCHQYSRDVLRIANKGDHRVVPIPVTERENAARQFGSLYR